jgi:hypothetical protein
MVDQRFLSAGCVFNGCIVLETSYVDVQNWSNDKIEASGDDIFCLQIVHFAAFYHF